MINATNSIAEINKNMEIRVKKINIKRKEISFFVPYGLYLFCLYFTRTKFYDDTEMIELLLQGARYLCYLILIVKLFTDKNNIREIIKFIFLLFIFACTLRISDKTMVFGLLFAYTARNINKDKIVRFMFWYCSVQFSIIIFLALIGVINNVKILMEDGRIRYALGFGHPNNTSLYFFIIMLLYFIIKKGNMKIKEVIFWAILSIVVYKFTKSRTGLLMDIALVLIIIFYKFICDCLRKHIIIRFFIASAAPIFAVMNYVIILIYEKHERITAITELASGRIKWAAKALEKYGLSICGRPVQWSYELGEQYLVVDSSYMRNLIEFGLIAFGLILLCYFVFSMYCINHNEPIYAIAAMLIAVYANSEIILTAFGINPLLVLWGPVFFNVTYSNRIRKLKGTEPGI